MSQTIVRIRMLASGHTIVLKIFITLKNTKANFARLTRGASTAVTTVTCVPSPTTSLSYPLMFLKRWIKTRTFICSTSRRSGAHLATRTIREMPVFMHTIGKIFGENHTYSTTVKTSVKPGKLRKTRKPTRMDVSLSTVVVAATDGKSKNTIPSISVSKNVAFPRALNAVRPIVLISIPMMNVATQLRSISVYSQEIGEPGRIRLASTRTISCR
jgi:hypothetical protein